MRQCEGVQQLWIYPILFRTVFNGYVNLNFSLTEISFRNFHCGFSVNRESQIQENV